MSNYNNDLLSLRRTELSNICNGHILLHKEKLRKQKKKVFHEKPFLNNSSPLLIATKSGQVSKVFSLLRFLSDFEHPNNNQETAMRIALENKYWDIFLMLLKNNLAFPADFDPNIVPENQKEIWNIISICQVYDNLIRHGRLEQIKMGYAAKIITQKFRNLRNQSAVSIAFENKQFDVFVFLKTKGFHEFKEERLLEINSLSVEDRLNIKLAISKITNNYRP